MDPVDLGSMTVDEIVAALGVSPERAQELLDIENGEWAGDVLVVDDAGNAVPTHHGENWKPE